MRTNNLKVPVGKTLAVMLGLYSCAVAGISMDDGKVLDVSIGNRGMTRLTVKGDSIEEILVHPVSLQDNLRHHGGHLFINPEGIKEPLYVTVMTQKGHTQDLQLLTTSSRGSPVILMPPDEEKKAEELSEEAKIVLEGHLHTFMQDKVPLGFIKVARSIPKRESGALQAYGEGFWQLGREEVMTYVLENRSDQILPLSPELFFKSGEQAVVFNQPFISPRGKARMAVLSLNAGKGNSFPSSAERTQP